MEKVIIEEFSLGMLEDAGKRAQQRRIKERKELQSFEWQKIGGIAGIIAAVASVLGLVWMVLTHYHII